MRLFLASLFLFSLFPVPAQASEPSFCKPPVMNPVSCHWEDGTLSVAANLRLYLLSNKNKRRMSVTLDSDQIGANFLIAPDIFRQITPDTSIKGRFYICPVAPKVEKHIEMICIDKIISTEQKTEEGDKK